MAELEFPSFPVLSWSLPRTGKSLPGPVLVPSQSKIPAFQLDPPEAQHMLSDVWDWTGPGREVGQDQDGIGNDGNSSSGDSNFEPYCPSKNRNPQSFSHYRGHEINAEKRLRQWVCLTGEWVRRCDGRSLKVIKHQRQHAVASVTEVAITTWEILRPLKGLCIANMRIHIFWLPLKEIECNQSYCHTKNRLGAKCQKSLVQLVACTSLCLCLSLSRFSPLPLALFFLSQVWSSSPSPSPSSSPSPSLSASRPLALSPSPSPSISLCLISVI